LHHSPPFLPVATPCLVVVISIVFSSDGTTVECEPSPQWTSPSHLCFWPLYPICNFAFVNICLYTVPLSIFCSSSYSTSLRIIAEYLTYSLLLSILLTCLPGNTFLEIPPLQWRTQEFFFGGVQQIQLRTEDRENKDMGVAAP
jgi:hypothetical protein